MDTAHLPATGWAAGSRIGRARLFSRHFGPGSIAPAIALQLFPELGQARSLTGTEDAAIPTGFTQTTLGATPVLYYLRNCSQTDSDPVYSTTSGLVSMTSSATRITS